MRIWNIHGHTATGLKMTGVRCCWTIIITNLLNVLDVVNYYFNFYNGNIWRWLFQTRIIITRTASSILSKILAKSISLIISSIHIWVFHIIFIILNNMTMFLHTYWITRDILPGNSWAVWGIFLDHKTDEFMTTKIYI